MNDRITGSLARLFEEKRIVFWYDAARDMRDAYDAVDIPGVTKLEIANNEFGLKYRILRLEREVKFLLYRAGPEPAYEHNWLLDVQLASTVFRADQTTIWLSELGLELAFAPVLQDHADFFRAKARVEALKKQRKSTDTPNQMRARMLAICVGAEGGLDTVVECLLADLAEERDEGVRLVERCKLTGFLWKQIGAAYGYPVEAPSIEDFAITLFKSAYAMGLGEDAALNSEALLMFRRWKNDKTGAGHFGTLSGRYAKALGIAKDLAAREPRDLMTLDTFEEIDRAIIRKLVHGLSTQTVSPGDVLKWVRERKQSHWYDQFADIYLAISHATEFQQGLAIATLGMSSLAEGFRRYATTWFKLDQHYRKFIFHMQKSGQTSLLSELFKRVENLYVNNYLLRVNDAWQEQVNRVDTWQIDSVDRQLDFYRVQADAFRRKDQKVCVIISDALRYEVADECLSRIRMIDRFEAELTPMLGVLPSYTQLGMAALLPHKALRLAEDDSAAVFDGEQSTQGTANREKILATGRAGDRVTARKAEDILSMRVEDGKALFRDHDLIYVYHNRIDAIGDKLATEEHLPDAVEDAINDVVVLVRKLTSANATNILITADHGFLYQHQDLAESDFAIADVEGDKILVRNRRFVLGKGLKETSGLKKFTSEQLSLTGSIDVLIPNSINRLRVKGAGSRFVHGGATLQEIVVPVLRVGKGRGSDIRHVNVQIIGSGKNLISSGQIAVIFYQVEAATDKVQPRELRAGIYAASGELISDLHELTFDFRSENARERELPRKFLLSRQADKFNNQDVFLKLQERVPKTNHFEDYVTQQFHLRRGLSTDFDF